MSADEEVLGRHVYLFGDYPGIGGVSWLSDQDRSTNLLPLNSSGCSRMKMPVGPIWSRGAGLRVSVARVASNPAVYDLPSRKWHWQCEKCAPDGYRFSHIAGTIFENTNKPLRDWYRVAHLMLTSTKGMSAMQIFRYMGFGSYKTAWEMCHKIRTALIEDIEKLGGIVEVDETFVGGRDENRHADK